MKITRDNYEAYVLDFLEGNLSERDEMAFEEFLNGHPDIREEISGMDQYVLVPDREIIYPDKSNLYRKDEAVVLSFWNIRTVAAAVAFLVVSTATLFIWKSSINESNIHPVDNQITITGPGKNLPATRSPMPESTSQNTTPQSSQSNKVKLPLQGVAQPETNVMVSQDKLSGEQKFTPNDSPALASGFGLKQNAILKSLSQVKNTPSSPDPLPIPKPSLQDLENSITDFNVKQIPPYPVPIPNPFIDNVENKIAVNVEIPKPAFIEPHTHSVAYLPIKTPENISPNVASRPLTVVIPPVDKSFVPSIEDTFNIHIPGEFLSDTWTDVSLAKFKKKLLPQFIKNQLNL